MRSDVQQMRNPASEEKGMFSLANIAAGSTHSRDMMGKQLEMVDEIP